MARPGYKDYPGLRKAWREIMQESFSDEVKAGEGHEEYRRRINTIYGPIREFDTGATRDTTEGKFEYGGFLSPIVLQRFGEYMHKHREQSDGTLRASDNWQKGMPVRVYLESLLRHVMDIWLYRLGFGERAEESYEEALCAALFNIQGLLFEELKGTERIRKLLDEADVEMGGCC